MTLQQLHQVITIAESRSMNEASRKLFVSQPNLSAVVRELEEEAGITIFIRSNRGIVLTLEGEEFIGYAKQVVEQGVPFAQAVAQAAGLPLACTTVPAAAARQVADRETTHRAPNEDRQTYYPVQVYVRTPWE